MKISLDCPFKGDEAANMYYPIYTMSQYVLLLALSWCLTYALYLFLFYCDNKLV
jgi:hypothetical protein